MYLATDWDMDHKGLHKGLHTAGNFDRGNIDGLLVNVYIYYICYMATIQCYKNFIVVDFYYI